MKKVTRTMFALALTAGASTLLASSMLFSIPSAAYADDASSTPVVATSTSPTSTTTQQTSSSTPAAQTTLTFTLGAGLSSGQTTGDNPIPVTATFSAPVTGFGASSLNIGNGSVQNFSTVSSSVYTFNVVPAAPSGTVSIDSNDPNVKDANGNIALAAPQVFVIYSSSLPNNTASSSNNGGNGSGNNGGGSTSTSSPNITWISGPADGSTVSTSTVTFEFSVASSSIASCSFGSVTAIYVCGSPQTFSGLVDGLYPFTIYAFLNNATTSSTHSFTVNLEAASSTTATTTATSTTSGNSGGSGSGSTGGSGGSFGSSGTSGQFVGFSGSGAGTSGQTAPSAPAITTGTTVSNPSGFSPVRSLHKEPVPVSPSSIDNSLTANTATVAGAGTSSTSTASDTQAAAAKVAGANTGILWTIVILLILAIAGVSIWSYNRNRQG